MDQAMNTVIARTTKSAKRVPVRVMAVVAVAAVIAVVAVVRTAAAVAMGVMVVVTTAMATVALPVEMKITGGPMESFEGQMANSLHMSFVSSNSKASRTLGEGMCKKGALEMACLTFFLFLISASNPEILFKDRSYSLSTLPVHHV